MAQFTVNGKTVTVEKNQKLMRYLRDELRLLSVKDGCAEGACGACTIIIDGKTQRACIPMTDKMEGKSVLTVEGLSDFEKQDGVSFLVIMFTGRNKLYYMRFSELKGYLERTEKGHPNNFKYDELDPKYFIDAKGGALVHYLEPLSRDLLDRD